MADYRHHALRPLASLDPIRAAWDCVVEHKWLVLCVRTFPWHLQKACGHTNKDKLRLRLDWTLAEIRCWSVWLGSWGQGDRGAGPDKEGIQGFHVRGIYKDTTCRNGHNDNAYVQGPELCATPLQGDLCEKVMNKILWVMLKHKGQIQRATWYECIDNTLKWRESLWPHWFVDYSFEALSLAIWLLRPFFLSFLSSLLDCHDHPLCSEFTLNPLLVVIERRLQGLRDIRFPLFLLPSVFWIVCTADCSL